jgi:hypothetical protein
MKKVLSLFFLLLTINVFAQLHQSLLLHLNDLPVYPNSYTEAGAKCRNPQNDACSADTVCAHFKSSHLALFTQLNSTMPAANTSMPDTSVARKVQQMTPEQQQAWAMQYALQQQQSATAQPVKVPGADELAFIKKYGEVNLTQSIFYDSITNGWQILTTDFNAHIKSINEKREQQIMKCPVISVGGNEPGPALSCVKQTEEDYQSALETYYSEWLTKAGNFITSKKTSLQYRYSGLEVLLAKTNYMANPSQATFQTDAISMQQGILASEAMIAGMISELWSHGCEIQQLISQSKLRA